MLGRSCSPCKYQSVKMCSKVGILSTLLCFCDSNRNVCYLSNLGRYTVILDMMVCKGHSEFSSSLTPSHTTS
jgi:hypothetical protein